MLTHIHIKNFRLVDTLEVELYAGLNILTGETGAGKSILIDAVDLALGARIDSQVVRPGNDYCLISLAFDLSKIPAAKDWLTEQEISDTENCLIQRRINADGKSRSMINGQPFSQNLVRQLGQLILNIHGQHDQQTLLNPENQQVVFDQFAQHETFLQQIQGLYRNWQKIHKELLQLKNQDHSQQLDFLNFQLNELAAFNLQPNEWDTLNTQHTQLNHAEDTLRYLQQAQQQLSESDEAILNKLQKILQLLHNIKDNHTALKNAEGLLSTAIVHVEEAYNEITQYQQRLDLNPETLQEIETRLSTLHQLARRHRVQPAELLNIQTQLEERIQTLTHVEDQIKKLEQEQADILQQYQTIAKNLTLSRQKAAPRFEKLITEKMQLLSMKGEFKIQFESSDKELNLYGHETLHFVISTNPGQPLQVLEKVVSGGELSRLSLALQVISHEQINIPSLIFDEVDTGIGGKTAETVGKLLRTLGESTQVLCITHLPQVGAQGHHHFKVEKTVVKNVTATSICHLNRKERVEELARMLSGSKITAQTLAHAMEILES